MKFVRILILLALFSGCGGVVVQHDLSERDANDIFVALHEEGIGAQVDRTEKAQDVSYLVKVAKKDVIAARKVLQERNLPRPPRVGMEELCGKDSLVPSIEEERCKKMLGLQGTLVKNLEKDYPGIVSASVILNIPTVSEFSTETQGSKRPSASVLIQARSDQSNNNLTEAKIQRYVANAVEGLDPRDVAVVLSFVDLPKSMGEGPTVVGNNLPQNMTSIAGMVMTSASKGRFKIYASVMLVLLIVVSAGLIFNVIRMTKLRQELKIAKLNAGPAALTATENPKMIEAKVVEGGTKSTAKPTPAEKKA
ncbi:MAG: hypothetical protein HYU97_10710 [Deltaproteobacteria bacterium]|nr:hypothetical protein [Deltaproteobacteria bacterium]